MISQGFKIGDFIENCSQCAHTGYTLGQMPAARSVASAQLWLLVSPWFSLVIRIPSFYPPQDRVSFMLPIAAKP